MRRIFRPLAIVVVLLTAHGCRTRREPLGLEAGASSDRTKSAVRGQGEELLNGLVGDWKLTGTLGGKAATHDIVARWVLNHEYLTVHEIDRDRTTNGQPAYEAIILLSAVPGSGDCSCLWLDTTAGTGLSSGVMGRGKAGNDSIPFVFKLPDGGALYNTFLYSTNAHTWQWIIESVEDGKRETFGHVTLNRK